MNPINEDKSRRILVIDDNPAIHEDFHKIFGAVTSNSESLDSVEASLFGDAPAAPRRATFALDSAYQGQEGLELVQKSITEGNPYAMAFVDVRMPPGWDGIETISRIWDVYPDLQVVVCTAYSDYSWDEMNEKLGNSDRMVILKKPFDNIEVMQLAGTMVEKWRLLLQARRHTEELEQILETRTEQLRKNEERFRLITENAADLIAIVDANGRRLYNSPSYQRLLGYTNDELQATGAYDQIHPDDRDSVISSARKAVETGVTGILEYRMRHKDGSWRMLESHGTPFRNAAGKIEGVLIVARDITERKQVEAERQHLEVQLRSSQKLESIGRLAAGVAHEINTPTQYIGDNTRFLEESFAELTPVLAAPRQLLRAIQANQVNPELIQSVEESLEMADVDYLLEEIPKAIGQSLQGVERVSSIVRAMKEFSHPGTGQKTSVDLNRAIESTLTVARNEWKYVAELETRFDPALPPVMCLPGEFNQVILNLIVNAAHAIEEVAKERAGKLGTITVSTRRDGDWVEIRIGDTGAGIPEHIRDHIFDPFFTTKGVGKGTGQGLAIARSVVTDKHQGALTFTSETGKGTTFIIRLPLQPAQTGGKTSN